MLHSQYGFMCKCASVPWGYAYPSSAPLVLRAISTHLPQDWRQHYSLVQAEGHCWCWAMFPPCSWFFLGGYLLANIFCWICLLFLPSLALKANLYKDSAWVFLPLTCCCPWTEVSFAQLLKLYPYSDQEETIGDLFVSLGPVLSSSYIRTFAVYATILCLHHSTQCFILEPKILCFVPYMF